MLRKLITTGMVLGFIACAFVPPTDANFGSAETIAKAEVGARTAATLLASAGVDRGKVDTAVKVLREVAPEPKKVVKRLSAAALTQMKLKKTSAYWKQVKNDSDDKNFVARMQDIEWATRKTDVRLCGVLIDTIPINTGEPTRGDYLALCLAKVTGDIARCDQIKTDITPVLKKLCTEELAT